MQNYRNIKAGIAVAIVLVLSGLAIYGVYHTLNQSNHPGLRQAFIGENTYWLEVARTKEEMEKGLGGRTSLSKNSGVLLAGPVDSEIGIWMKDMRFDIDVLWVNHEDKIVYIVHSMRPDSFPRVYQNPPESLADYVIELAAGEAMRSGVKLGDIIRFIDR